MYISFESNAIFKRNPNFTALFKDNSTINDNGGALYVYVTFKGNSVAMFDSNDAFTNGGVLYMFTVVSCIPCSYSLYT